MNWDDWFDYDPEDLEEIVAGQIEAMLENDETWTDASGIVHRLETMDEQHRFNVLGFVRRNAGAYYRIVGPRAWAQAPNSSAWLERSPLVTKLRSLVGEDFSVVITDEPISLEARP